MSLLRTIFTKRAFSLIDLMCLAFAMFQFGRFVQMH